MKRRLQALYSLLVGVVTAAVLTVPAYASANPYTGDDSRKYLPVIIGVLVVSAIAIVAVLVMSKKGKGKKGKKRPGARR